MMDERREQALDGGRQTVGIARVGDTVRRPRHARSDFVHALLRHLEAVDFEGAPRLLGIDERGRQVLTYINGQTIDSSPASSAIALVSAARLIRCFHDTTAGTALAATEEIVAHGDLGAHNLVFDGDTAVAIIDWDDDAAPGQPPRARNGPSSVWLARRVPGRHVRLPACRTAHAGGSDRAIGGTLGVMACSVCPGRADL